MSRPQKTTKKTEVISIRMTASLKEWLQEKGKIEDRDLSVECERRLRKSAQIEGYKPE